MRNARVRKFTAMRDKSVAFVKSDGMGLGIEVQGGIAASSSLIDQECQDRIAHATAAPLTQYCHAPDMSIRQQPAGANGTPPSIMRQRMQRHHIEFIPFQ